MPNDAPWAIRAQRAGLKSPAKRMPRIRPRRGSQRGVELSKPLLRVYTPEASVRPRERLASRERFAHPAAVREASLVGIQTRADRSQATGAGIPYVPVFGLGHPFHRSCGRDDEVVGASL